MQKPQTWTIALIALTGLLASGLWLWTGLKSWKGVMLQRQVNHGKPITGETLVDVWEQIRYLDRTFLPGAHVYLPGFVSRVVITEESIPIEIRAEALIAGQTSIENALARAPANSAAWARLTWFRYLRQGPSPEVLAALRMSIYMAPTKKSLLFWRIEMAGLNREYWDANFENIIKHQISYASRISKRRLNVALQNAGLEHLLQHSP